MEEFCKCKMRQNARYLAVALASLAASAQLVAGADLHGTIRVAGKPQKNAVIWIDAAGSPKNTIENTPLIDQRNLTFSPHVLAVRVGTTVDFPNDDRVLHNVFSFRDGKRFDLGMYPVGALRRVTFDRPGLSRIFCNIHPNMAAYVMAVDSPYFAVSDEYGAFTIASVAPGTYTYHAWRSGAAEQTGTWASASGQALTIS